MPCKSDSSVIKEISHFNGILENLFGVSEWRKKDPLDELILTILSQNTNDKNRDRAYGKLREQFPTWQDVLNADVKAIEAAIQSAGLGKQKSERIHAILTWVKDTFGGLTLAGLKNIDDDEVIEILTEQKGIGIKTAAVLLAFAFDRDLCPVDTHVHRISRRLGWVEPKDGAEATFKKIRPLIPTGKASTFHLNLLRFGRAICTARKPLCGECPVWDYCVWEGKKVDSH